MYNYKLEEIDSKIGNLEQFIDNAKLSYNQLQSYQLRLDNLYTKRDRILNENTNKNIKYNKKDYLVLIIMIAIQLTLGLLFLIIA